MPISTRQRGDTSTNRFVPTRVLVPIQPAHDVYTLFGDVHERLQAAKRETALNAAEGLAGVIAGLPTSLLVAMTRSQTRTIDFGASNLHVVSYSVPVDLYVYQTELHFAPATENASIM
jgi:hypothetical protein